MLRLPDGMREQIKASANRNNRSMNAEIIQRLEWSFSMEPAPNPEDFDYTVDLPSRVTVLDSDTKAEDFQKALIDAHRLALDSVLKRFGVRDLLIDKDENEQD